MQKSPPVIFNMPEAPSDPGPDPETERMKERAERERIQTIRQGLSGETDRLVRTFGARSALSGGRMRAPIFGA